MKDWFIVWKDVFLSHLLNKNENIINLVTGYSLYFLKIWKINAQQEKPICPNRKKFSPTKHKKWPIPKNKFPQKFRATRYFIIFVAPTS